MTISFYKYQGAGNDFIIIDEQHQTFLSNHPEKNNLIYRLCDRRFGIGADGLMILKAAEKYDFQMIYFNSDGQEGTMCGNGGRCLVAFAAHQNLIKQKALFLAVDGLHQADILKNNGNNAVVSLQMKDVSNIRQINDGYFLDTGSPHYVIFTHNVNEINVEELGRELRLLPDFGVGGANVNFAQIDNDKILVRTFERGVEAETLACGTGITATAIAAHFAGLQNNKTPFELKAMGGNLKVSFYSPEPGLYQQVYLEGPATKVFRGEIHIA